MRNPKDALVSLYHYYKTNVTLGNYAGSWNEWFDWMKEGKLLYGCPFVYWRDWWIYAKVRKPIREANFDKAFSGSQSWEITSKKPLWDYHPRIVKGESNLWKPLFGSNFKREATLDISL